MHDYNIEQLTQASPSGGVFDSQIKPSKQVVQALEQFRDHEARTDWQRETADAMLEYFRNEVKQ